MGYLGANPFGVGIQSQGLQSYLPWQGQQSLTPFSNLGAFGGGTQPQTLQTLQALPQQLQQIQLLQQYQQQILQQLAQIVPTQLQQIHLAVQTLLQQIQHLQQQYQPLGQSSPIGFGLMSQGMMGQPSGQVM